MPKIVDHAERRRQIADAMWRLIAREGISAASARSVAAEGGWSLGAVRHYFATQDELVRFAAEAMADQVAARVDGIIEQHPPGLKRCQLMLEELLPLDERRLGEIRAWLAVVLRAQTDPALDGIRLLGWQAERHLCRLVVAELIGRPLPEPQQPLPKAAEAQAATLHALVDGLTLQAVTVPEQFPSVELRRAVRAQLRRI